MSNTAEINLQEKIDLLLSVNDQDGNPVPGAVITQVVWKQDVLLGVITPDPHDPTKATFVPAVAGKTHITASAVVTIP